MRGYGNIANPTPVIGGTWYYHQVPYLPHEDFSKGFPESHRDELAGMIIEL